MTDTSQVSESHLIGHDTNSDGPKRLAREHTALFRAVAVWLGLIVGLLAVLVIAQWSAF